MIKRYRNPEIEETSSDENKLLLWQEVELAVIEAREKLGRIPQGTTARVKACLDAHPIDLAWWEQRDNEIHHDLQAAVDERRRHLPDELKKEYHKGNTSYDTEEPAFSEMLRMSTDEVQQIAHELRCAIKEKALAYRFTPMLARTHGQWAQIQSFGYECLTWHEDLSIPLADISDAASRLRFTKCSGAVGNNSEIDPELEYEVLKILGKQPWHGATQIMPRSLYASLASGLAHLVTQCEKIATDIRLAARSGYKTLEEPFNPNQKGSSAMPQKRNPIRLEQICGMGRAARHFAGMLEENIVTWESRDISQSCVERIAWPDLFHVTMRVLTVLTKVIEGLNVYPDVMMREIAMSAGTYASNAAKTFLAEHGAEFGIGPDDAYGIVRLASHITFEPNGAESTVRQSSLASLEFADNMYAEFEKYLRVVATSIPESIEVIIATGSLHTREDIGVSAETAGTWADKLTALFESVKLADEWQALFAPSRGMRNEAHAFKQVFKV